uniref:F-box domain-containing protein n=1 Tax=Fagus sylvatica TaxID=28930 RepID=A0A2N9HUK4_FAGSY
MSDNASVSYDFLPDEIVTQILIRLPIKSIITSICVCKTWKSIIQNPTFISTHLHHSTTTNHLLLFSISSGSEQIYALHNDDDNDFTEHTSYESIGFGFDRKTNDYKVVRMGSLRDDPDCGKDRPMVEVFREIPLPQLRDYNPEDDDIELSAVYGNSIALFHSSYFRGFLDIWVMKEYGVASSWTKVLAFTEHNPGDSPLALGFRRNSQLVLQVQDLKLISVDLGNQNMKDLGYQNGKDIGINTFKYTFVGSYVESLVLLDKAANGAVTN